MAAVLPCRVSRTYRPQSRNHPQNSRSYNYAYLLGVRRSRRY
jgi:hypothetical protein